MGKFHELHLPGEDVILKGMEDLSKGIESIESLLVSIGAPRLQNLNFVIPKPTYNEFPEMRLYRLLENENPRTAHARMNAYIRLLVSFERSLEHLNRDKTNINITF